MEKIKELITINKGKKPKIISPEPQNSFLPYVDIKAFEKNIIDNYTDGELMKRLKNRGYTCK